MLNDRDEGGEYRIPFLVVCDAFQSETTAFADLVLPDTTYLERHDVMSMLDRPISEFDGPVDSVRVPVVPPTGQCKPFQDVLIELRVATAAPGVHLDADGSRKFRLSGLRRQLRNGAGSGIGFLVRLARRERRPVPQGRAQSRRSGRSTRTTTACTTTACPPSYQYMRNWNKGYMDMGAARAYPPLRRADPDPALLGGAADVPPRRAGQAARSRSRRAPARTRGALRRSAAVLVPAARGRARPIARAIRWRRSRSGRWRCIHVGLAERVAAADPHRTSTCSSIRGPRARRASPTAADGGRVAMGTRALHGALLGGGRAGDACGRGTRSARRPARGGSMPSANEASAGSSEPPHHRGAAGGGTAASRNADPITGQAGWYDVRVRIEAGGRRSRRDVALRSHTMPADAGTDAQRRTCPPTARSRERAGPLQARTSPKRAAEESMTQLALRHRPQRLRGLPRVRHELQGMEHVRRRRAR